jgi:lysophospholipase L1-like esterase
MLSWVPLVVLSPLLLVQGKYVRRVTPKLPEPPGQRQGTEGVGAPLKLLVIGDSAAAGVGARSQSVALSGRLVKTLAMRCAVSWQLFAESGLATDELLDRLAAAPRQSFDVALISIGVNDVVAGRTTRRWTRALAKVVAMLQQDFGVRHVLLSELPPMHCFTALPQPLRWCMGLRAKRFNHVLAGFVGNTPQCTLVPLDYPMEAHFLAADGFHPGEPAYAFWADIVAACIFRLPVLPVAEPGGA